MARPITWQNVNAPSGGAAAIEALLRSGRQAGAGFERIGQTLGDINTNIREEATGASLAQIATSNDPLAQAAAAPDTWQFDQLAIARAANARGTQLQQQEATQENIQASRASTAMNAARLKDLEDQRQGALAAQEGFGYVDRTGKIPEFAKDDPLAGTTAGVYAQEAWREHLKQNQDNNLRQETLRLARSREQKDKNTENALSAITLEYATRKVHGEDPGARDPNLLRILKEHGAPASALGYARAAATASFAGNTPTAQELGQIDRATGKPLGEFVGFLGAEAEAVQRNTLAQASQYDNAVRASGLLTNNRYEGLSEEMAAKLFVETTSAGEGWSPDWDADDVQQRVKKIKKHAKDEYGAVLGQDEAFLIAESTIGRYTPFDSFGIIGFKGSKVDNLIRDMSDLVRKGGTAGMNADLAAIKANGDADLAKIARERGQIFAALDGNGEVPKSIRDRYQANPVVRQQALQAELAIVEQQIHEIAKLVQAGQAPQSALIALSNKAAQIRNSLAPGQ